MPLNQKQKEAVETIQGPLLVLAGPGTGKTHLLSSRVEYILKTTDADVENILCLTFTESGASNMRERLISTVGSAARRIEIHTYHAFGSDLLAQYKNYAEKYDRNLDAQIDTVTQFKIIREIQEGLEPFDILKSGGAADIVSTIANAKAARLSGDDLIKIAKKNIETSAEISAEVSPILEAAKSGARFSEAAEKTFLPILKILGEKRSDEYIVGQIEINTNAMYRDLKRALEAEAEKEKPSARPLTDFRNKYFVKDEDGHYISKDRVANKKLESLGRIMNKYDDYLRERGYYDFSDMIEEAIRILKKDKGFRLTLQEKFQYILLDEFQDTNPSQFELIKLLTDYEQPNVMAVGDDDQAIFEFQGADASNLITFQEYYNAKVINLEENYRSNQEILDFARKIADELDDSFAKKRELKKELNAFKGAGGKIERHEFISADAEYYFVAEEIEKLIKRGVKQSEIAIIAPKHKYILPLLPYLKASGKINIAYEKRDNLLEDRRLAELITLSRFVYDLSRVKMSAHRLLEILAFPFFEIPPIEAITTVQEARNEKRNALDYLKKSESAKLRELAEYLATLVLRSYDTPLELFIDYLTGSAPVQLGKDEEMGEVREFRSPFLEYYDREQDEYGTFELYENLAVLKEKIKAHTKNENPRLEDFITMVEDYQAAGVQVQNTSPYQDSADAIQIVTAHKSKGLEYQYCFLIATDNVAWGKGKGNNNMLVLPKNVTQIRHTGATDDERIRLFFVALTRAKSNLILSNSLRDFSGKSPKRLDYLEEYVGEGGEVISPLIPDGKGGFGVKVVSHYEDLDEAKKKTDLRKSWVAAYKKLTPSLRPILEKRLENYQLTASDLTCFVDLHYAGPIEFYKRKVLRAPGEPASESILFGNLVHATFERITNTGVSDEEAVKFYLREAEKQDVEEKVIKNLKERGRQSLEISLKSFGAELRAENAKAEVNLYSEHLSVFEVPVTGKIDHIRVYPETKEIEIFDFKTGTYHPESWDRIESLFKYKLQLLFYKLLLNVSPSYKKYQVSRAHILFVSPDADGKVYDKVLEFKEKDEREEIELIRAVYREIQGLRFMDDEKLKLEADKGKGLKEIKEFIRLIVDKAGNLE
ncbi:ATP-dependent helicase [Candidatus Saccharibacteria bacterium]|nr:ATP-dependent helicase [Candidatus Saccharibacteria bacterium]